MFSITVENLHILELSTVSFGTFRIVNLGTADKKSIQIKLEGNSEYPHMDVKPGHSLLVSSQSTVHPGQSLLSPGQTMPSPGQSLLERNPFAMKSDQSLFKSKQESAANENKPAIVIEPSFFGPSYKPKKRKRRCKQCGSEFSNWIQYKNHRAEVHGEAITFRCLLCDQQFSSRELLGEHKTAVHGQTSSFYCPICSRTFLNTQACKDHMASHENIKRYECLICNMKFTHISSYRRHSRICRQR